MALTMAKIKAMAAAVERARAVARQFAAAARRHFGKRLKAVRLYGSAARGDWTKESDIDVLVLLDRVRPKDTDWLIHRAALLGLHGSGLLLQPLFMTESAFAKMLARELLFALEVQREGIDL
jgi:predicted nucleotidyltransferase